MRPRTRSLPRCGEAFAFRTLPLQALKILSTSDLHNNGDWYHRLGNQADDYDLVAIAGDLLDMFSKVPTADQVEITTDF
jgi:hypothetical protein